MIVNLYDPVEGRRHNCALLAMSNLLQDLREFPYGVNGQVLCLFGDPAYSIRRHLQSLFCGAHLNQQQRDFNKSMSQVRVTNVQGQRHTYKCYTCLYKNNVSTFFGVDPPLLEDYTQ